MELIADSDQDDFQQDYPNKKKSLIENNEIELTSKRSNDEKINLGETEEQDIPQDDNNDAIVIPPRYKTLFISL